MKKIILSSAVFIAAYASQSLAAQASPALYANPITSHNIGVIQHSIFNAADTGFDMMGLHVGMRAPQQNTTTQAANNPNTHQDYTKLYGTMPMYGSMSMYGEYGDDIAIYSAPGRSGGDTPIGLSTWATWQHFADHEKFKNMRTLKTNTDLIMAGIGAIRHPMGTGHATFGAYAGYVGGDQHNSHMDITENAGFIGGYGAYHIGQLMASGTITLGHQKNDIAKKFGGDDFNNTWMGLGAQTTYDILIDPTFTLQPGVYAGYTWIKSSDYTTADIKIKNSNLHLFEITPNIRAIKHIANGWFGSLNGKYIMRFADGGEVRANSYNLTDLDTRNYFEYGIALEKSFGALNAGIQINRRDGGRSGWNGLINIKYAF